MKCVKCNAELPDGSKFCKYCGTPQPAAQPAPAPSQGVFCQKCGKALPAGSKFCKYCGATIGAGQNPVREAAAPPVPSTSGTSTVPPVPSASGTSTVPPTPPMPGTSPVPPTPPMPGTSPVPPAPPKPPVEGPAPQPKPPVPPVETAARTGGSAAGGGYVPPNQGYGPGNGTAPQNYTNPGNQEPPKKNTGLIIGCVVAAIVLVIAIVALVIVLAKPKKESDSLNGADSDVTVSEDAGDVEETVEEPQEESTEKEQQEQQEESAQQPASEAEAAFLEKQASGISGNVDYGTVTYSPSAMDAYQSYDSSLVSRLLEGGELYNDAVLTGSLYSVSENQDLAVEVFYHPETYEVERIVTIQQEESHQHVYDAYYADGELRMIWDYITKSYDRYNNTAYDKNYRLLYTNDRLVELQIDRGEGGAVESYRCADFETMDDGVQTLFLARETDYLNRAYTNYAAVTQ